MQASYRSLVVVAFGIFAAPLAAEEVPVCEREHRTRVQATACAKAAESVTALRRYTWATGMIHNLRPEPFLRSSAPREPAAATRPRARRDRDRLPSAALERNPGRAARFGD